MHLKVTSHSRSNLLDLYSRLYVECKVIHLTDPFPVSLNLGILAGGLPILVVNQEVLGEFHLRPTQSLQLLLD